MRIQAVRQYPQGALAAHVLGYAGEVSRVRASVDSTRRYQYGDIVGKAGAEKSVREGAAGRPRAAGSSKWTLQGRPRRVIQDSEPVAGRDVVLTIDSKVQTVTEQALAQAMEDAHKAKFPKAKAGAAVAIDVKTGEVIAMASLPTYDPSCSWVAYLEKNWQALTSKELGVPAHQPSDHGAVSRRLDVQGDDGPCRSRGRRSRRPAPRTIARASGSAWASSGRSGAGTTPDTEPRRSWRASGTPATRYFYEIGYRFYKDKGEKLQKFARRFGFGSDSGIDLPGEAEGRIPDAAWKAAYNENYPEYQKWLPGDTVNLAIGQGDLLVTPLQLARRLRGNRQRRQGDEAARPEAGARRARQAGPQGTASGRLRRPRRRNATSRP